MGFSTAQALFTEGVTNGKTWETQFYKTSGATAYTAGRWYDTSMWNGFPRLNVYPGGLAEATKLYYRSSGAINAGTPLVAVIDSNAIAISAGLTITNSSNLFLKCGFMAGMTISISGFSTSANNTTKIISTVAAGVITVTNTVGLVAEAAGQNVTITDTTSVGTKHITKANIWATVATVTNATALLCDYLMFYALFDMDLSDYQEATTSIALPRYSTGEGVQMFMVVTTDLGANPGITMQVTYVNSNGETNRLAQPVTLVPSAIPTHIPYTISTALATGGAYPFIPLQQGDSGVKRIQGVQLSNGTGSGWGCIVLVKPLLHMSVRAANITTEKDLFKDMPTFPQIKDQAFLSWLLFSGGAVAAASPLGGYLEYTWGNT